MPVAPHAGGQGVIVGLIAAARLKSDGVGNLAPAAANESDAGRALKRRVERVRGQ